MRSAQITIKDIAKKLGISPSTVSRTLKDHPSSTEVIETQLIIRESTVKRKVYTY